MRFSNILGLAFAALGALGMLLLYCDGPPPATVDEARATTIVLVRHAEKADDGTDDPPLTDEGRERARALADVLEDASLDAVLATPYRRTQATAAPAAERFDVPVSVTPVEGGTEAHAAGVAQAIVEEHVGRSVLVVGHSNTIPAIVEAIGGEIPAIADDEYDRLVVMVLLPDGSVRLVEARYGEPGRVPAAA